MSKALLRHPQARSELSDMSGETIFQRYLPEPHPESMVAPEEVRRHILCTGQVYYTLLKERDARGIKDIAISRLEQISPFPYELVSGTQNVREFMADNSPIAHPSSRQVS